MLQENNWIDEVGRGNKTISVVVKQPEVEHKMRVQDFERWLVWNTLAITKIVTLLRGTGETIVDEDLGRISPLMHQHVIPNGTYHFGRA